MTATKRFGCGEGPQAKREGMTGLRKPQRPLRVGGLSRSRGRAAILRCRVARIR